MTPQPLDPCVLEGLLEETATLKDAQDKSETLGLTEDFLSFSSYYLIIYESTISIKLLFYFISAVAPKCSMFLTTHNYC